MSSNAHMQTRWRRRIGFLLEFFAAESAVFAIITLSPEMSFAILLPIHAALTAVLFVLALLLRRSVWGRRYALVCAALFVAAVVFTLMHTQVSYAPEMLQSLAIVLGLSLLWGVLIQKTDSLWGAVLFHAADDCLIILPAFASL